MRKTLRNTERSGDEYEKYKYHSKKGNKEKDGSRTVRTDVVLPIAEFEKDFYKRGNQYECKNDQHHWPIFLNNGLGVSFHMDYLENLSTTPKLEPQNAHFNNKQTSLQNTDDTNNKQHLGVSYWHFIIFRNLGFGYS